MFSYLKFFFVFSIALILVATIFFGLYYRSNAESLVMEKTEKYNISVTNGYINSVWKKYSDLKIDNDSSAMSLLLNQVDLITRPSIAEYQQLAQDSTSYLQKMEIVDFKVYGLKRSDVFLSITDGKLDNPSTYNKLTVNPEAYTVAISGKPSSAVKVVGKKSLVITLIPILRTDRKLSEIPANAPKADAVIEISYNAYSDLKSLGTFQYIGMGLIISIFAVLFTLLIFTSRRAEKIIEKQHDTNMDLVSAKVKAEAANEQKSQFLASISHELRTPLNAIIGFSEIIKDEVMGAVGNEQYKNYIRDIHSSGVHLLSLINDILDFSKAEAGKLEFEFEDIDLNKLIVSCMRLQEPRANTGEVALEKDLPADHVVIKSDAKRLKQVLLNLLSNAVKFTPPAGKVKVSLWLNVTDNTIGLEVADTGIGIAPKDLAKAMAPFGQVSSDLSRRYEGTGLGLPLTKKFTELLGGEMEIHSDVGQGTKVRIFLPKDSSRDKVIGKVSQIIA